MPPNPNVQPEFRHQLSPDQTAAVDQAALQGRAENTLGWAMRNIIQRHPDDPELALQDLATGRTALEAEWNILDTNPARTPGTPEQTRYEQLERQIKGNDQLRASIPGAYQRERAEEMISYQRMDLTELAGIVNSLRERLQLANDAKNAARRTAGRSYAHDPAYERADTAAQMAHTRLQQAENVFNQRDQPNRDLQAQERQRAAQLAAAQRELQRQAEENRVRIQREELERSDVKGLRNEITRLGTQVTDLQARRHARELAGAGAEELAEIDRDTARAQERNAEADRILGTKLTGATGAIDQDLAKSTEESFAQRATSVQLSNEIVHRTGAVNRLRTSVRGLRDQLNNPPPGMTPDQRRDLQNQLYDDTQSLKREEDVLNLFQEAQYKSNREFREMDPDQRSKELAKIGEEIDILNFTWVTINSRLYRGLNVTKEEMAAWAKLTVAKLVEHGGRGFKRAELTRIFAMRPELSLAVAAGIKNSEEGRRLLREKFPTAGEKILDLVKKYPLLLAFILAILAGFATAAGVAFAPAIGAAIGGGGAAAGGAGVFGIGRRAA